MNLAIKSLKWLLVLGILLLPNVSQANEDPAPDAFNKLIGEWAIEDSMLNKEGKWVSGPGADWSFYKILNGAAIQDDWISPSMDSPEPKQGRQYGTNVRIYNPQEKRWEMLWASNTGKKLEGFVATADGSKIVMRGDYNGADTRITFYAIEEQSFAWKMERIIDEQWKEIYRIKGVRKDAS